ncbi:hypothetical protein EXIGLDRAFT_760088 [Exidia glandulosa HHB12029]|uniref:Phytochrome n=1 Tax=Exidia glandulosa HHB12029 TaxID=1314781 RepID=A0A165PJ51_EXIGL|nr:hypothetical protein EXIGLDRAFT_760088 [Exidia glandulosa HHB12029]
MTSRKNTPPPPIPTILTPTPPPLAQTPSQEGSTSSRSRSVQLSDQGEAPPSDTSSIVLLPPIRPPSLLTGTGSAAHPSPYASSASVGGPGDDGVGEPSEEAQEAQHASEQREHQREEDAQERERQLVTTRFEHVQDKDGHHTIIGREGKITRCEDEPIRIPGAVQGFGVLVALREEEDTGNFLVRQVSENSTEILGLSPKYLFSLECFTDTLPEDQADVLWDNLRFLSNLTLDGSDPNDNAPQVFLLSGFGEPGSAPSDDPLTVGDDMGRRRWTCWCAVHRPPQKSEAVTPQVGGGGKRTPLDDTPPPPLLVLEFELEVDTLNPLYPPQTATTDSSGGSSRSGDTVGSGPVTTGSVDSGGTGSTLSGTTQMGDPPSSAGASGSHLNLSATSQAVVFAGDGPKPGLDGEEDWFPSPEEVLASTTSHSKPLRELERMRAAGGGATPRYRFGVGGAIPAMLASPSSGGVPSAGTGGSAANRMERRKQKSERGASGVPPTVDIFTVLGQANDQLSNAQDLETFLKIVVGLVKDLTQFHRVLVYQFDEAWNGQTVAELVDWSKTHDLYKGLHFPAADIPKQARELYLINRVRLLYNTTQQTARLVCKAEEDLATPLDMTHSFLRAMSPIHIKYLGNMGVRASMSISIVAFGQLWGLVACHSYGDAGMRVSFPMRHMLRLLSDSISRNIERLSYAQRLHSRKLVSTMPTDQNPSGYIISNAEDLLTLFDADFGVLVVGDGAKIMGENVHGQETLILAEYLRLKQFPHMQVTKCLRDDFPDLRLPSGPEVVSGMLYVPLSRNGKDFIAFLRQGQLRHVHWAGKPFKQQNEDGATLEPRKSFKTWSQTIGGKSRAWTDEQLETAAVLALVYGKFIEVWRQKETALQASQLTSLLLSNASHEVRTPLHQIINYLELALNGPLDEETRENLTRSHIASKSLLFTINDLLDLTRLESGQETSFNEPFDLQATIIDAARLYQNEASRRGLAFFVDTITSPRMVWGDSKKIRTVVANLTANAVKYTEVGRITVLCRSFNEPEGLRDDGQVAVEIVIEDTGRGIPADKLSSIFRQFENTVNDSAESVPGVGLGLAVVARIVEQLGGQLRVDSELGRGSRFSFLMPFVRYEPGRTYEQSRGAIAEHLSSVESASSSSVDAPSTRSSGSYRSRSGASELESLVQALGTPVTRAPPSRPSSAAKSKGKERAEGERSEGPGNGEFPVAGSYFPVRSIKVDETTVEPRSRMGRSRESRVGGMHGIRLPMRRKRAVAPAQNKLRVLVVDDDPINRKLLATRLGRDGHTVSQCADGVEAVDLVQTGDRGFDCVLMDIQMPMLNGFDATKRIREIEQEAPMLSSEDLRLSLALNGRIPIFAVSASLLERQRDEMMEYGMDGWILKPIDYKRMNVILRGILDIVQRNSDVYTPGCNWEAGGWLLQPPSPASELSVSAHSSQVGEPTSPPSTQPQVGTSTAEDVAAQTTS